jgi:hypothetical protein
MADLIWDAGAAERAVVKLLPTFNRIMAEEESAGVPPGEMVRNRRFAEAVRVAVLPAQRRDGGSSLATLRVPKPPPSWQSGSLA